MKTIMIIGAGKAQVPLIKAAKREGYYIIVCDWNPEAPGVQLADEFCKVSTKDRIGLYKTAKAKKIDGIAWPTDADQISKSRRLFERILQLQDTTFKTENALAAYSMAKIHDRLSKEKEDLPGNTAIEILRYFNIAVEWSRLAHNQNLLNAFSQEKNALIDQVTKYYDGLIDYYYNYDLKDEEERYRHYKDAFLAAVNEKS